MRTVLFDKDTNYITDKPIDLPCLITVINSNFKLAINGEVYFVEDVSLDYRSKENLTTQYVLIGDKK